MAKKDYLGGTLKILAIVALVVFIIVLIGIFTGYINLGSISINDISLDDVDYVPQTESSCWSYHITSEFENAYGPAAIAKLEDNCEDIGGIWTGDDTQMTCFWNPDAFLVDCESEPMKVLETFCEDSLKATWSCLPDKAFLGCHCSGSVPDDWEDQCYWKLIDKVPDYSVPAFARVEWKSDLPAGQFKFKWYYPDTFPTEIIKNTLGVAIYNDKIGSHEFSDDSSNDWGIAVTNTNIDSEKVTIELYQWICPDDALNFDPGMFDEPYSIQEQLQGGGPFV